MPADSRSWPSKAAVLVAVAALVLSALPLGAAALTAPTTTAIAEDSDPGNVSRVFVEPRYERLELKPGESDSLTVTVVNDDDHAVTLSPEVVQPRQARYRIKDAWVDIDAPTTELAAGEEVEVTVSVAVPEDAELARYRGEVAFTNETVQYGDAPPRRVHTLNLNVEVFEEPTVFVRSERYLHSQVEAGESYTHSIVVENTDDEAVPLNPEIETRRNSCHGPGCPASLDRSWLSIDAPTEVPAGDTATVEVTVSPSANADRGRYDAELTLGLEDPNRPQDDRYWQRLDLNFQVWKQPDSPFETTFAVRETDESVAVELSAGDYYRMENGEPASFDVAFVAPNGTVVDAERTTTTKRGHVDLSGQPRGADADRAYAVNGGQRTFEYRLPAEDPAAGEWTLRVMPQDTVQFGYRIVRNASA
ncbi:COG1470 family protein [Halorarius litoreus]|uniref:COG1470 family protein n=1 Tax=Halorarius litoreus TaxID=2962676 RepID=UPI0020CDBFA0|nr:DUF916 domain-containing protein [Halorarius litoreus]